MSITNTKKNSIPNIFSWQDDQTDAKGWVVWDTVINDVAGGGIFMHPDATEKETCDIAANMTKKFTVTSPQIGGAKAGIRFDPRDPRASEVLRRFIKSNAPLLKSIWVTAGDLGTDDALVEKFVQEEVGLPTCQATLARKYALTCHKSDLSTQLASLIQFPASPFFPLIEGAVGYGIAASIETVLRLSDKAELSRELSRELPRVMIQGFGAVGSSLAYYLFEKKIARVVGISDAFGFIHDQKGLDIVKLLEWREKIKRSLDGKDKNEITRISKSITPLVEKQNKTEITPDEKDSLARFLNSESFDIFCPCANRYAITPSIASLLVEKKVQVIASGANNPFGTSDGKSEDCKEVPEIFQRNGVCVIPDYVANSGTAQLFHRGISVEFDLKEKRVEHKVLEACAEPIRDFIDQAWKLLTKDKLSYQHSSCLPLLRKACLKLTEHRIAHPLPFQVHDDDVSQKESRTRCNPAQSVYGLSPLPLAKQLDLATRMKLVMSVTGGVDENCVKISQLEELLRTCPSPVAYDGFEPSNRMHIAQGLIKRYNVNKMTRAGFTFLFWVADYFAQLNNKMGGDLDKIQTLGRYFIEVWKSCGMDMERVRFIWAKEEILRRSEEYLKLEIDIARKFPLSRLKRCCTIMGKKDEGKLQTSDVLYPVMQCADIFFLGVDVCQLGLDQLKVNVLAKEYAEKSNLPSPVILSHPMLSGLKKNQAKMSKSDPSSAIFMEDSTEEVNEKIKSAYCPERETKENPCMEYVERIVFDAPEFQHGVEFDVKGVSSKFGDFESFKIAYEAGLVTPQSLKSTLAKSINVLLEPVRKHFEQDLSAKELLCQVKKICT